MIDKNKQIVPLAGSGGGGKGGGGRAPTEVKDNQFSDVIARVLIAYSSGTTDGLINGAKGIYLNRTQLMSDIDVPNFQGVSTVQSYGDGLVYTSGDAPVNKGITKISTFEQTTNTISINTALEFDNPVIRTVSDVDVDAVRIIITVPALQQISTNGDIKGTSVDLRFEVRDPTSGIWEGLQDVTITGKSSGPFQRAFTILNPETKTGAWDWRVTRITEDSLSSRLQNDTTVQAAVEIFYGRETYDGTATVGLEFNTSDFGNSLPEIAFKVSGVNVRVPTNYTITNGIPNYSGIWNGTWKYESTSNPVWHLYNLLVDDRVGLGLPESFIDRYNFYEAARYCDAVDSNGDFVGVDDGAGGVRRRFTFNTQINGQKEGIELCQEIASSMRAILYFGAGAVVLKQDAPRATSKIVTNDNVKDGIFAYSTTQAKDRITVAKVGYNDPDDFFALKYSMYPLESEWAADPNIARFGRNELEVTKMGCANEAEANAFAQWIVYTSCNEDRTVTFTGGPEFMLSRPGEVIEIADRRLAGAANFSQRYGGRIASGSFIGVVQLDYPIELAVGESYTITIVSEDGTTLETRNVITGAGANVTSIAVDAPFSAIPTTGYTWLVSGTDIAPQKFQVINVERKDGLEVEIFAVKYDENKYAAVEQSAAVVEKPYTKIDVTVAEPPTNITFQQVPQNDQFRGPANKLIVRWTPSTSSLVSRYRVRYRRQNDIYTELVQTSVNEATLDGVIEGVYEFYITAVNPLGYESTPLTGSYEVTYNSIFEWNGQPIVIEPPVVPAPFDVDTKDMKVSWTRNPLNDVPGVVFKDYKIEVREFFLNTLLRTEYTTNTEFTYYFDDMILDQASLLESGRSAYRIIKFNISERDPFGNESLPATAQVSNNRPGLLPVFSLTPSDDNVLINITPDENQDIAGYRIFRGTTPGFTKDSSSLVYEGPNPTYLDSGLVRETTYYYAVQIYDLYDSRISTQVNSAELSTTTLDLVSTADVTTYTFAGIVFTTSGANVNWTAGTVFQVLGTSVLTNTVNGGSAAYAGSTVYIFFNPDNPTMLSAGTNLSTIYQLATGVRILATWNGTTLHEGLDKPIIDGANILAETIGATQLVTSNLITNTAQISDGIITTAQIVNAAITNAKIANLAVSEAQIQDAAITNAKIGNLSVDTAKIQNLSVEYLKIGENAVTDSGFTIFANAAPTLVGGVKTVDFIGNIVYDHPCVIIFTFDAGPATASILGSDTMTTQINIDGTTRFTATYTGLPMTYAVRGLQIAQNGLANFGIPIPVVITLSFNQTMNISLARAQFTYQVYYR